MLRGGVGSDCNRIHRRPSDGSVLGTGRQRSAVRPRGHFQCVPTMLINCIADCLRFQRDHQSWLQRNVCTPIAAPFQDLTLWSRGCCFDPDSAKGMLGEWCTGIPSLCASDTDCSNQGTCSATGSCICDQAHTGHACKQTVIRKVRCVLPLKRL